MFPNLFVSALRVSSAPLDVLMKARRLLFTQAGAVISQQDDQADQPFPLPLEARLRDPSHYESGFDLQALQAPSSSARLAELASNLVLSARSGCVGNLFTGNLQPPYQNEAGLALGVFADGDTVIPTASGHQEGRLTKNDDGGAADDHLG
ncbi:hypothetical protein K402DRAFT_422910 [Aulographum hederae CBS 113979]|uniref:Uncharacterized protein n=1 Tax=Aulographum hederae CBS 113979 TaxID=1176131 RepID=A0A6G1GUD5_9PEZI|nr:hypothetical protein K402DRAFT_422910 [Aulographum hederae CBS 113979]